MAFESEWPDEVKIRAVQLLKAGLSQRKVAEVTGVPKSTVWEWMNQARQAGEVFAIHNQKEWTDAYMEVSHRGAKILAENLERYEGRDMSPLDLKNIAIVAGISTDKALDLRDGRTKNSVNIDNRQVHVTLTTEQAAALIEEATKYKKLPAGDAATG